MKRRTSHVPKLKHKLLKFIFTCLKHSRQLDIVKTNRVRLHFKLDSRINLELFGSTKIGIKVARYSFLECIPPTFECKLRRHKQRFGKINTTVVSDKDETLLWSGLQLHRSCHGNEMTPLPILLAAVFLGTGNCSSKIVYWSFFLQKPPRCS